ncbi:MAG: class I SAM-dependent methyltransferase [Pirellula sp.]
MTTDYNQIAKEYQASKLQPWRTHIERATLLQILGSIEGLLTLDLACGEGYYTRLLRRLGAVEVCGIDLSTKMIDLAREQELSEGLGIEYRVGDARAIDYEASFDLVFAAYLLNYASDAGELRAMCQAIARSLKPGGRFVTVNNNPDDPISNFEAGRGYGYSKRLEGSLEEGSPILWSLHLADKTIEVTNYYLKKSTLESALDAAGLGTIRWHVPCVSDEGIEQYGAAYWQRFLAQPPIVFLECFKREGRSGDGTFSV